MAPALTLIGRSSSHFTRVARIYAHELGLEYVFEPVLDIKSTDQKTFADNPALTVPSLRTPDGTWFGSLAICRELARRSSSAPRLVWPEDLTDPVCSNALEIVLSAMGAEVSIVMARGAGIAEGHAFYEKPFARLKGAVDWLEANIDAALATLPPDRKLSFLEVSTFCFLTHLAFRELGTFTGRPKLEALCLSFAERASAEKTPYRFDSAVPAT
jgi:glutathione S-transferase